MVGNSKVLVSLSQGNTYFRIAQVAHLIDIMEVVKGITNVEKRIKETEKEMGPKTARCLIQSRLNSVEFYIFHINSWKHFAFQAFARSYHDAIVQISI